MIAKVCLRGNEAAEDAKLICRRIIDARAERLISGIQVDELVETLLSLHPHVVLDCWLGGVPDKSSLQDMLLFDIEDRNPLGKVPIPILLVWAQVDPDTRFPRLPGVIPAFEQKDNATAWSETALALLSAAPDRAAVLQGLGIQLHPSGWSGSVAVILEKRRPLIQQFLDDQDPEVRQVARAVDYALLQDIEGECSSEVDRDERFE
jgi:hypothetical protein